MGRSRELFFSFVVSERSHHARRLRFAGLMCVLILGLLYETRWWGLRPGLAILLAGQAGVVVTLFFRNKQLSKTLAARGTQAPQENSFTAWFEGEEALARRLMFFESACQMLGFAVLGYEFWVATRSLWIALGIGVVYPITIYFAMTRRKHVNMIRHLVIKKEEIAAVAY